MKLTLTKHDILHLCWARDEAGSQGRHAIHEGLERIIQQWVSGIVPEEPEEPEDAPEEPEETHPFPAMLTGAVLRLEALERRFERHEEEVKELFKRLQYDLQGVEEGLGAVERWRHS